MQIIIYLVISYLLGILSMFLFNKFFLNKRTNKKNIEKGVQPKTATKYFKDERLQHINLLLEAIRNNNFKLEMASKIMKSLKEIALSKNWDKELDNETLDNLETIYFQWQKTINKPKNTNIIKTGDSGGFEQPKYWEGTFKEFQEACKNGLIDEHTNVNIVESDENYRGSWIGMDSNGDIEEYMD